MSDQNINSMCLEVGPRLCAAWCKGRNGCAGSPGGPTDAICVELAESAPSGGERSEFVIHSFRQKHHFVALPFTYKHISL